MDNFEDDDSVINLNDEEVQEIIDWAVSAAAIVTLMHHAPEHYNVETSMEKLEGYIQAITIMVTNLPDSLVEPAHAVASEALEDAEREQVIVDEFLEEIKDL